VTRQAFLARGELWTAIGFAQCRPRRIVTTMRDEAPHPVRIRGDDAGNAYSEMVGSARDSVAQHSLTHNDVDAEDLAFRPMPTPGSIDANTLRGGVLE
jgi:hypothetical protein